MKHFLIKNLHNPSCMKYLLYIVERLQKSIIYNGLLLFFVIGIILSNILTDQMTVLLFIWNTILLYFVLKWFLRAIKLKKEEIMQLLETNEEIEFDEEEYKELRNQNYKDQENED